MISEGFLSPSRHPDEGRDPDGLGLLGHDVGARGLGPGLRRDDERPAMT